MNQYELGEKVGVASNYISMLERGERYPSFAILIKLSEAFDMTTSLLLNEAESIA